jgi:Piwi domain
MAYVRETPDNAELRPLREELGGDWFVYWREGIVFGLPLVVVPSQSFGQAEELACEDHLQLLAARICNALPDRFPEFEALRQRPFTFLGTKGEIVERIRRALPGLPALTAKFAIHPRIELDAKLIELREGETAIGLFMDMSTRWVIEACLSELEEAGVDLRGLYVVRRNPQPGQRRLVGRISHLSGNEVILSESHEDLEAVGEDEVQLEGSRMSFARCLQPLLQYHYQAFENERYRQEAQLFTGPALERLLGRMGALLRQASPLALAPDLTCSIGDLLELKNDETYQSIVTARPVEYCFDAARTKRSEYPWNGIEGYGPFSRDTFPKRSPRIVVVFPDTVQGPVEHFLRLLRDGINLPNGTSHYAAGFAKTFDLVNPTFDLRPVRWMASARRNVGQAYRESIHEYLAEERLNPDAAIVVILDEHARLEEIENPYLQSKAVLLMAGIPVQDVRVPTLSQTPQSLQYILQNITVSLYAKMNGTPWTVDHDLTISDELVVGMGTCELSGSRFQERQRYIGITTVFRGDGNYLLGNVSRECRYEDYPETLRETTLSVLRDIKERNGWRPGDTVRTVFHVPKRLRDIEVADIVGKCVAEVGREQNIQFAFLTVSQDHPFTAIDPTEKGVPARYRSAERKGVYVPARGTILQLGRYTRLLCTSGPSLVKKENSPLPRPLLVHLHPQSTFVDLAYLTEQVLKFTSLSWRSTLPAKKPVSIYYSELIAGLLSRLRSVPDWSPAMLNVKLRASRWFL